MAAPTLFLIDGSNQMYRAYHAIRGLTGPDGKSTNAVYGFVTMLRKLLADHQPAYIAASFDLPGETFRAKLSADYKANRAAMPDDLAEQIAVGARGVRSDGRADPHLPRASRPTMSSARWRRRRPPPGSRWRSSPATRTSSSWSATASASTTRATTAPGSTRTAWSRSSACRRTQVVDVLALMGDASDNVKGVPGIGEKGARDLITTLRLARRAAGARRRGDAEEVPRRPARPRRRGAAEPRAGDDPHRRRRAVRCRARSASRARRASAATRCSRRSASARWSPSSRPPRNRW